MLGSKLKFYEVVFACCVSLARCCFQCCVLRSCLDMTGFVLGWVLHFTHFKKAVLVRTSLRTAYQLKGRFCCYKVLLQSLIKSIMPAYRSALLFGLVFSSHQCPIISGLVCCWVFGFELNHRRLGVQFAVHFLPMACYCWLGGCGGVQF